MKNKKNKYKWPIILTIIIVVAFSAVFCFLDKKYYSAIGSLIGGFGSIIAVIWFFTSLQYQAQQLEEQQKQFSKGFQKISEDGRRSALALAKSILCEAEDRALRRSGMKEISELGTLYTKHIIDYKKILQERNPEILQIIISTWSEKVEPANILLRGIKSAAEIYFTSIGLNDIDYSKSPEEFITTYGDKLWDKPFFSNYHAPAIILAPIVINCIPYTETVKLTFEICVDILLNDSGKGKLGIIDSINKHKAKGYPIPKIADIRYG